ncbi:hypothetical protein GCM10022251_25410 [Phytohabitans flavus]
MGDLARLRAATYAGRDPRGLAAATVDGDGLVVEVTFADGIGRHQPAAVGEAVRLAVSDARQRMAAAYRALAPEPAEEPSAPHLLGGATQEREAR